MAAAFASMAAGAAPRKHALLNKPAPSFARTSLQNDAVDLAGLRGRVVLLNFWATWCGPCQVEMPRFVQWQDKYKADGLSIVGVSMDDDSEPVKSFLRKRKLNYPIVMGDETLGLAYGGILGLPVTYLIDRQGMIRARYQGKTKLDAMEAAMQRLLQTR
jgi:thiol-disulfide isomerase/thioredoxin